jgi:hypothetical protein
MCFHFIYNLCLKRFSFYEEWSEMGSKMFIDLHVKYPLIKLGSGTVKHN